MDRDELESKLEELCSALDELESEEPDDILSNAYDVWEEKQSELEDLIDDLEERLEDLDD